MGINIQIGFPVTRKNSTRRVCLAESIEHEITVDIDDCIPVARIFPQEIETQVLLKI